MKWFLALAGGLLAGAAMGQGTVLPGGVVVPGVLPPTIEVAGRAAEEAPVVFEKYEVFAKVVGLYTRVETTLTLRNPNTRVLEGDLRFPLPDGGVVCGYALDVGGRMVEGVVVPKERARVAFEAEVRRGIDPGLVEQVKGNVYETRVYPIPGGGTRRVKVTYVAPLVLSGDGEAAFLLAAPREPLKELRVRVEVPMEGAGAPILGGLGDRRFEAAEAIWRVEGTERDVRSGGDIWVALPKMGGEERAVVERGADGGFYFAVSAMAGEGGGGGGAGEMPRHVLWDASGSRAGADLEKEYALLERLPEEGKFWLTIFRDRPEETRIFRKRANLLAAVKAAPLDGGTDFAALAGAMGKGGRYLLFTDGFDTLSGEAVDFGGRDVTAVVSQTGADWGALRRACGGRVIDVRAMGVEGAAAEIVWPSTTVVGLEGDGVSLVEGIGARAAGRVRLLGRLDGEEAEVRIRYGDGRESGPMVLRRSDAKGGDVVAVAWAAARAAELGVDPGGNERLLLALGRRFGVVSSATSLLVLESLDQWVRHGIEPPKSWPEMREAWLGAMKGVRLGEEREAARHLAWLGKAWAERVAWWEGKGAGEGLLRAREGVEVPLGGRGGVAGGVGLRAMVAGANLGEDAADIGAFAVAGGEEEGGEEEGARILVKAWAPEAPYLRGIREAGDVGARYTAYMEARKEWALSPGFYLDCAEIFVGEDVALARRILTNLAELRMEDPALLRVLAWRLQGLPGGLDPAIVLLRRVAVLRPEEPQSFRDLALALVERGEGGAVAADLTEAGELLKRVALTPWKRHADFISLFALEELNALVARSEGAFREGEGPTFPEMPEDLRKNLPVDVRVVLTWDADNTDVDLHIVEPSEEEAYYAHPRTASGGLVSYDVTDGYGPEEYLIREGGVGAYRVVAHYFGSSQQRLMGPATVSATIFTHWGMATQERERLTLRLDKPKEAVEVGRVTFGE